jgi:deazaflavin-dependent oxidoreductase (nitroreductase family)
LPEQRLTGPLSIGYSSEFDSAIGQSHDVSMNSQPPPSLNDRNRTIIEEFRGNQGKVTGRHATNTLLLLTTEGAKSGKTHTTPVGYLADGDRFVVFATKAGAPTNPDWYHNLVAHPVVTVEVGDEKFKARATPLKGEERDRLYARQVERAPSFAEYEQRTSRRIPVVALDRID